MAQYGAGAEIKRFEVEQADDKRIDPVTLAAIMDQIAATAPVNQKAQQAYAALAAKRQARPLPQKLPVAAKPQGSAQAFAAFLLAS
jgi:hypothetical protein